MKIALLHLDIHHRAPGRNRGVLAAAAEAAAGAGAQLIVAPEMAISGYAFDTPEQVRPFAESADGPTAQALGAITRQHACSIVFGLAEHDPATGRFYNSAVVIGNRGKVIRVYRKLNAEHRWATAGAVTQDPTFSTPAGPAAVSVCSDIYYSFMPHLAVRYGARLLVAPANWPPTQLDPRRLWRLRAAECGVPLIVCNRTGRDQRMNCAAARSFAVLPDGTVLADHCSPESTTVWFDLPDDAMARAPRSAAATASRRHPRDFAVRQREPPAPGVLRIRAATSTAATTAGPARRRGQETKANARLIVLHRATLAAARQLAAAEDAMVIAGDATGQAFVVCARRRDEHFAAADVPVVLDGAAARLAVVSAPLLASPAAAMAALARGCDVLVCLAATVSGVCDAAGRRALDRLVVVAAAADGALITVPPVGHDCWREDRAAGDTGVEVCVDIAPVRERLFLRCLDPAACLDAIERPVSRWQCCGRGLKPEV